jgi:trimeric autotransporter adhesin
LSGQVNGGGYSPLMTLTSGGNVGIGTGVPLSGAVVTINANTSGLDAQTGFPVVIGGADGVSSGVLMDAFGTQAAVHAQRYDGTNASRSALVSGDPIINVAARGWNGSAMSGTVGNFFLAADGAFTTTSEPTRFVVQTAAVNATSTTERMRITSSGNVGIGTNAPSYLLHVGNSSASGIVMELQNSPGASPTIREQAR